MVDVNILHSIDNLYKTMDAHITAAKNKANIQGKQLLIIVGEHHSCYDDLLLQAVLLKAASDHGAKKFYTESDAEMLDQSRIKPGVARKMVSDFIVPMAEHGLDMAVVGIEKPDIGIRKGLTLEGIAEREDYMTRQLLTADQDAVLTLGQHHLKTFIESELLKQKFFAASFMPASGAVITLHSDSPLGRLSKEREKYNSTSKDIVRVDLPTELESVPPKIVFQILLGRNFLNFDKALDVGPKEAGHSLPASVDASLSNSVRNRISERDLREAERINPRLVKDYKEGRNCLDIIISTGTVSRVRMAKACQNQPEIAELIRLSGPSLAIAQGQMDIQRLERMSVFEIAMLKEQFMINPDLGLNCYYENIASQRVPSVSPNISSPAVTSLVPSRPGGKQQAKKMEPVVR